MSELEPNMKKQNVFMDEEQPLGKTASGLDAPLAGLLCYLLGFVSGIIFLLIEKENRYVRFHALQSIFTFGALFIVGTVINVIPLLGLLINILMMPISMILWIFLMVKAYQGKWFKLPIVGDLAEKQLK